MKKTYQLINFNCAHCSDKINNSLQNIKNIKNHSLNFVKKELKIEIEDEDYKKTIQNIKKIITDIESNIEFKEKENIQLKFRLENLFCQSCSLKIEKSILNLDEINDGFYNFSNQILTVDVPEYTNVQDLMKTIQELVDNIEDGVTVKIQEDSNLDATVKKTKNSKIYLNLAGLIIFLILLNFESTKDNFYFFIVPYLLVAYDILLLAFKNLKNKNPFDENFLMTIATLGAFAIKEYPEAISVMIFYKIGEFFQEKAVTKSRNSIESLLNIKPQWANLYLNNTVRKVKPHEVSVGNTIIVQPGECVPLDGIVIKGASSLDIKALTGESIPKDVSNGDEVLSGSINLNSSLEVKVTKNYKNSTVTKILDLVENASLKKAKTEKFITKFSYFYTPIVVFSAIFVGLIIPIFAGNFQIWFYKALIFLVISCPCALVVSIPLGYFGGIGRASKHGILIKGGNYLEALTNVNKIILDKTGTITKGEFYVKSISSTISNDELINYAIIGEIDSTHPISIAIKKYKYLNVQRDQIQSYETIQGHGTKTVYNNEVILVGNKKLMSRYNIKFPDFEELSTTVHVAKNDIYLGSILLEDEIKNDTYDFVKKAKLLNIELIMLSGDNEKACKNVAKALNISKYYSQLLPQDKIAFTEKELTLKKKTIFVGDGINDAPVLKRADIGISMGGIGSDAAIEASDIVIMDDNLNKILTAIEIAKKTKKIVIQNIVFALGVKTLVLTLGLWGHSTMWEAIFADVGVALIAILNSIRALKD